MSKPPVLEVAPVAVLKFWSSGIHDIVESEPNCSAYLSQAHGCRGIFGSAYLQ